MPKPALTHTHTHKPKNTASHKHRQKKLVGENCTQRKMLVKEEEEKTKSNIKHRALGTQREWVKWCSCGNIKTPSIERNEQKGGFGNRRSERQKKIRVYGKITWSKLYWKIHPADGTTYTYRAQLMSIVHKYSLEFSFSLLSLLAFVVVFFSFSVALHAYSFCIRLLMCKRLLSLYLVRKRKQSR